MFRRRIAWKSQPQYPTGVNRKWVDRGLVALFDARQAREIISGDFATNRTSLLTPSLGGMAADFSGTANQQYAHRPAYAVTGPITIVAYCDIDALTNYSAIISKMGTTTTNAPYELRVGAASANSFINFARANTLVRDRRGTSNRLTAPFSGLIAVTAPSGLIESAATLYVNNVPTVLSSNASGTGLGTDNGSAVWIGRRYDGATQLDGRIYYVALFNRALTDGELQEIYESKYDLYQPLSDQVYLAPNAGGGTDVSVDVTGLTGTTALGDETITAIQNASTSVTGLTGTSALGTVTVTTGGAVSVNVTGLLGTSALGAVSVTAIQNASTSVTGLTGTSALGSVTVDVGGSTSVNVTGLLGTSALGTVSVTAVRNTSTSVTGLLGTSALGSVTVTTGSGADVSVNVTGLSGTASHFILTGTPGFSLLNSAL